MLLGVNWRESGIQWVFHGFLYQAGSIACFRAIFANLFFNPLKSDDIYSSLVSLYRRELICKNL